MDQRRRYPWFSAHVLLIAVAIQGTTPDSHDVSSSNALQLLCPAQSPRDSLRQDDGMPDEVCGPIRSEYLSTLREIVHLQDATPFSPWAGSPSMRRVPFQTSFSGPGHVLPDDVGHLSCRLIC
jgi:hypothetical protein